MPIRPHIAEINPANCFTSDACLEAVREDLEQLEGEFGQYLEQESLKGDVQCLRNWIELYQKGDSEGADNLREHGSALLANIKEKLQVAAREIQRIDEESPIGGNFSGGKADRLNSAATAVIHAEEQLGKALNEEETPPSAQHIAK